LNGDGRMDVLIAATAVHGYRIPDYELLISAALQRMDGSVETVADPFAIDGTIATWDVPPEWGVKLVMPPGPDGAPALLVGGATLVRAATAAQAPTIVSLSGAEQFTAQGQPDPTLP